MKNLLLSVVIGISLTIPAFADDIGSIQLDGTFERAQNWLSRESLNITGNSSGLRDDNAAFSQETILFYGEGFGNPAHVNPAQRETMAKRAAVVVAQKALAEYLEGFALVGDTQVKDGAINYDLIRTSVAAYIKGTQVVFQDYDKDKDMAIAVIKLGIYGPKGFGTMIYEKMVGDPKLKNKLISHKPVFRSAPITLDESYDSLIVDATDQDFRPALINRLFSSNGKLLYDPAKLSKKVLIRQGCGEYTSSIEKARVALASRGGNNPLIVKAEGSTNPSDLLLSDEDAVTVFSADRKAGFFRQARIAFVLK